MKWKGMSRVTDHNEMKEMKKTLQELQAQVNDLTHHSRRRRSGWASFAIGFIIVFVVLLLGIGVLQFISAGSKY